MGRLNRCIQGFALAAATAVGSAAPAQPQLTYQHDIRPILAEHCVGCHRPGDIAPMSLQTYGQVRPWARAIRQAVLLRKMPPWDASPNPAHPFRNDRSLTAQQVQTIEAWADSGAPEGEAADTTAQAAAQPLPTDAAPSLAEPTPDIVVPIPGFAVPSSGSLPYSFLIVPLHLTKDTWIRSAEFHIDQRRVIHHINAFVRPPNSSYLRGFPSNRIFVPTVADRARREGGEKVFDRRELLLGYEPGYRPGPWLPDAGKLIRAGSDIVFELHYNPNGKAVVDRSELRLYFAATRPAQRVLAIDTLRDLDLRIPPENAAYQSAVELPLASTVRLLSVQPHMHYRGKSMRVEVVRSDGTVDQLVDVPRYDFNWQTTYTYRGLVPLQPGWTLRSTAVFDNSRANPSNPDPAQEVHWGDQTTDEMHIAFLELVIPADADPEKIFKVQPRGLAAPKSTGE